MIENETVVKTLTLWGHKKALAGILQKNETLSDFVEFKLRMKPVCKFRNNDFIIDAIKRKIRKNEKKK